MIRRPPRSTRTDTLFPTRRSSDLRVPCDVSLGLPRAAQGGGRDAALDGADRAVDRRDRADRVQLHVPRAAALCAPRGADRAGDGTDGRAGYQAGVRLFGGAARLRSEEHTSEITSLMRNSYAVYCLKKKTN